MVLKWKYCKCWFFPLWIPENNWVCICHTSLSHSSTVLLDICLSKAHSDNSFSQFPADREICGVCWSFPFPLSPLPLQCLRSWVEVSSKTKRRTRLMGCPVAAGHISDASIDSRPSVASCWPRLSVRVLMQINDSFSKVKQSFIPLSGGWLDHMDPWCGLRADLVLERPLMYTSRLFPADMFLNREIRRYSYCRCTQHLIKSYKSFNFGLERTSMLHQRPARVCKTY